MGAGELFAVLALLLFAGNAFVVRAAAMRVEQNLGFLVALVANVVVAGVASVGVLLISPAPQALSWPPALLFLASGVLSTYLGRRGYFLSVESMGPTRAGAVQATNPVFAVFFAWLLLGQQVLPLDLTAILVVVIGLWATTRTGSGAQSAGVRVVALRALVPAVFSAICYAAGNVVRAEAMDRWAEPVLGGFLAAVSGTVVYAAVVYGRRGLPTVRGVRRSGLWLWSLSGALTVAGQILVIASIGAIPVGVAVAISSALPAVVLPVSVLFLRGAERITWWTAGGVVLVVAGVTLLATT